MKIFSAPIITKIRKLFSARCSYTFQLPREPTGEINFHYLEEAVYIRNIQQQPITTVVKPESSLPALGIEHRPSRVRGGDVNHSTTQTDEHVHVLII